MERNDWVTPEVLADEVAGLARRRARNPRVISVGAPEGTDQGLLRAGILARLDEHGLPGVSVEIDRAESLCLLLVEFDRWL